MKNRADHNADSGRKGKAGKKSLLCSFVKTGKEIAGSVIFWCAAVSIAASACHIAKDVTASFAKNWKAGEAEAALSGERIAGGTTLPAISQEAGNDSSDGSVPDSSLSAVGGQDSSSGENNPPAPLKKTVALTFDDGPHPVYTKKLLDGLLERGVKATFFVIGENIPGNEDLIARMEKEGHLIGNHTYNHVKICDMKKEDACYQVEQTSALVREITGHDTEFVRPPFGAWNPDLECSFVMIPVLWDVDPLDWTTSNTPLVVQRVVEDADDQDIILLHDFYESSVDAALQIVDILKKEGFEFATVDKLILP